MEADCWSYDGIKWIHTHKHKPAHCHNSCLFKEDVILNAVYHCVLIGLSPPLFCSRGESCLCFLTRPIRVLPQAVWRKMPGRSVTLSPWALRCSAPSHFLKTLAFTVSHPTGCLDVPYIGENVPFVVLSLIMFTKYYGYKPLLISTLYIEFNTH